MATETDAYSIYVFGFLDALAERIDGKEPEEVLRGKILGNFICRINSGSINTGKDEYFGTKKLSAAVDFYN